MISNRKFFLLALAYGLAISLLIAVGVQHDTNLFNNELRADQIKVSADNFATTFLVFTGVYLARICILCLPFLSKNTKWESVTKYGLYASVLPEIFIVLVSFGLLFSSQETCEASGSFSNCGWAQILIFLPIAASVLIQLLAMIVVFMAGVYNRRAET